VVEAMTALRNHPRWHVHFQLLLLALLIALTLLLWSDTRALRALPG
jgi:hypothetical protein